MGNIDEQILRAAKEIVVKFIEAGRISPSGFHETFKDIYRTIEKTTQASIKPAHEGGLAKSEPKEVLEKKRKKNK